MEIAYSIEYILSQIDKIQQQAELLNTALEKLSQMSDGDSGEPGAPGNIQGQAKARGFADIVKCRETTNQKMLDLYEKMYDDLKLQKVNANTELIQTMLDKALEQVDMASEDKAEMVYKITKLLTGVTDK